MRWMARNGDLLLSDEVTIVNEADLIAPGGRGLPIQFVNNPAQDAFQRLRISNPVTIFDSQLQYDGQPLLWETQTAGGGSETHIPAESAVTLDVGTADGDRAIRQTREYMRYQPGKSQLVLLTGVLGAAQTGTEKLIGYGDDDNGIFLGQDGGGVFVLLRSSNTGGVSDARKVYQDAWNIDALDGAGPSGITLDATKTQIVVIDLEWLGVGRVRIGLNIDGVVIEAHEFLNANIESKTYMTTANLPVRYEIRNTQAVGAASTLKHICSTVVSEGGVQETLSFPFSTEVVDLAIPNGEGSAVVVFAARHALTFNSIANRGLFLPAAYEVLPSGGNVVVRVLYNPTITGGAWAAVDAQSFMEGNATATGFSGGINIGSSVIAGGAAKASTPVFGKTVTSKLPFGTGIDADTPINLALIAYATSANVSASFTFAWEEQR